MSQLTWYVTPNGTLRTRAITMIEGEELKQDIDWNPYLGHKSTNANSITFTSEDDSIVGIANATLASGVSTVEMGANSVGRAMVKAEVELASGEVLVRKFMVTVTDPDYSGSSSTAYQ